MVTEQKVISTGMCNLCKASFNKAAMARHLGACLKKVTANHKSPGSRLTRSFHLVVKGYSCWWLHLEARVDARLYDLDAFLRQIWLECCGHMSCFRIAGNYYVSASGWFQPDLDGDDEGMDLELQEVLEPKMKFRHQYDFGTTTDLDLRVVAEHETLLKQEPIELLARNDPPATACVFCGKPAQKICRECMYQGEGTLCNKCASQHECGEESLRPLVNSPRIGMCAYT